MIRDTYGSEIKVGSRVAFNYSGNVCIGTVEEIRKGRKKWPDYIKGRDYHFHIRHQDGGTSVIKNQDCIAVI